MSDVIFFSSLLVSISLGSYYKDISDINLKRNYGTGLGILLACLICGHQIIHTALMVWGNIVILKCCDRRYVHQLSLVYTWIYLIYLHINLRSIYAIWIHQTLALRLVGLAYEFSLAQKIKSVQKSSSMKLNMSDDSGTDPSAVDIITYAYFFVGLHKGPYYRWKTFEDHFSNTFGTISDCRMLTEHKLKKVCLCFIGYSLLRMKFSYHMYFKDDFYIQHGTDFRFLYNIPQLIMYFLYHQMIMLLCTSVCTEAGFGVYPAKCTPMPGIGPTVRHSFLKLLENENPDVVDKEEYNFSTMTCFKNEKVLLGPKMRDTLRSWYMPTRYWFWANIYKNTVKANKEVRSACSFLLWTMWAGPSLPLLIVSTTLWAYIHLETEYSELYEVDGAMKLPWDIGYSIMRMFCLIYLTPCLIIHNNTGVVLRYYNSIFWIYHVILFMLMLFAITLYKSRSGEAVT